MERAARKAGHRLRRDFGEVEQLQVSQKGPSDFVSNADLKSERLARLMEMQRRIQLRKNQDHVGRTVEVLVDGVSNKKTPGVLSGRSPHNRMVNFPGSADWLGRFVAVRITRAGPNSLFGEPTSMI